MKEILIAVHKILKNMFIVLIGYVFFFTAPILQIMSFIAIIVVVFNIFTQPFSFKELILGILLSIALFYSGTALDTIVKNFDKNSLDQSEKQKEV